MAINKKNSLQKKLSKIRFEEEENKAKELAQKWNLPYLNLLFKPVDIKALVFLEEDAAREAKMAVIQKSGKTMVAVIRGLENKKTQEVLQNLENKGFKLKLYVVSESGMEKAWQGYKKISKKAKNISGFVKMSGETIEFFQKEIKNLSNLSEHLKTLPRGDISKALEIILAGAIQTEASDIHFEREQTYSRLRFRIDGILQDIIELDPKIHDLLLSRVKLLSSLKLNVGYRAQSGRFSIVPPDKSKGGENEMEIRASVTPSEFGEDIVLRILNPKFLLSIQELGLREDLQKVIQKELLRPNGIILVTGPTGCGKTTTLYAFLKKLYNSKIKIITIEDPIEYHIEGISQTQIKTDKGYDFSDALRSVLRQDPDVILVGEIRDSLTAQTASRAALTGHLVFSTLHTNNAVGVFPQLINLGQSPNTISSGLNIAIAQRLLRRICNKCSLAYEPPQKIIIKLKNTLVGLPKELQPKLKKIRLKSPKGCGLCHNTGYKGRIGVFEFFVIDKEIKKFLLLNPSLPDLQEKAEKGGMVTMLQDGLLRVLEGVTTIEEVERVLGKM